MYGCTGPSSWMRDYLMWKTRDSILMCMERLHVWRALIHHHYTTEGEKLDMAETFFDFSVALQLDRTAALSVVLTWPPRRTWAARTASGWGFDLAKNHANSTTLNKALTRGRLDGGPTHTFACLLREIVGHLVARVPLQWSSFGLQEVLNVIVLSISDELDFSGKKKIPK